MIDGRLHVPKTVEVLQLGHTLTALCFSESVASPKLLQQLMQKVGEMIARLGVQKAHWHREPWHTALPLVGLHPQHGLCLVTQAPTHHLPWAIETPKGFRPWNGISTRWVFCSVALGWREQLKSGGLGLTKCVLLRHRGAFVGMLMLTLAVNLVIAGVACWLSLSFEQNMVGIDLHSLSLLGLGGLLSVGLTSFLDLLRQKIGTRLAMDVDADLAHQTFERLLKVRADTYMMQTESIAVHMQGFASIRSFSLTALTLMLIDIPVAMLFGCLIWSATAPAMAYVTGLCVCLKLLQALVLLWRAERLYTSIESPTQSHAGLMQSAVTDAETVKSLGLRAFLNHCFGVATQQQLKANQGVQRLTEITMNDNPGLRQLGLICWLLVSVYQIEAGSDFSLGAWVGCSMLVTRVIHPVSSLPTLCMQWLQAKLALRSIDRIFKLPVDVSEQIESPLSGVDTGQVLLKDVCFVHPNQYDDLAIGHWLVKPGERVGIVGAVGGGRSTLLKLISGLYKPQRGQIRLAEHDVQDLPRELLNRKVAYLPQNVPLFSGTLRDNLRAGLKDVTDAELMQICQRVGLMGMVNAHALGLDMPLQEGPHGLSVGQRQLVGIARLLLRKPLIWLLDEPLANLDACLQQRIIGVFKQNMGPQQTLIVVGQQPALLDMVDRLCVLNAGRLILDGPRDKVMSTWQTRHVFSAL
jgi:ATP-binding cassette subfamily C protein LapB